MHHNLIDKYAKKSRFYSFDSRAKIIAIFIFVIIVALLKDIHTLLFSNIFILTVVVISNIPFHHYIKRYLVSLPFILFAAFSMYISNNYTFAITIFLRISCCVFALILLSSTTSFFDLLKGFQSLKVPSIFIILLMFTYRYIFVLINELQRMKLARKARGFRGGKHLFDKNSMRIISNTIGMVFVRSYVRGVRIYDALLLRGYDGKIKTLKPLQFTFRDFGFCFVFISISTLLICYDLTVIF